MTRLTDSRQGGTVRELPENLRPRELLEQRGLREVQDDVLLAVILRSGVRGQNVVELARHLIRTYGSLSALAAASPEELSKAGRGLGKVKAQVLAAALELGRRMEAERLPRKFKVRTPADAAAVIRPCAGGLEREVFWTLCLDAKQGLKGSPEKISSGVLDASLVHPREVFSGAIKSAAASVVVVHNHPSGDPTPSSEDLRITKQLVEAGRILDIRVLDHVIIGRTCEGRQQDYISLRESGLVKFDA